MHLAFPETATTTLYSAPIVFDRNAHLVPILVRVADHTAILVIASGVYLFLTQGKPDTLNIAWTFELTGYLRAIGFFSVALYLGLYERYHYICVTTREAEMRAAGLADGMQGGFSYRSFKQNFLDYFAIPVVAPMFGSIPASQAQICHFWTQDLAYNVSAKPVRKGPKPIRNDISTQ